MTRSPPIENHHRLHVERDGRDPPAQEPANIYVRNALPAKG